jgi:hypothetical protein
MSHDKTWIADPDKPGSWLEERQAKKENRIDRFCEEAERLTWASCQSRSLESTRATQTGWHRRAGRSQNEWGK